MPLTHVFTLSPPVVDNPEAHPSTTYDLLANVTHESVAGTTRDKENTVWKCHVRAGSGGGDNEKWFLIQDLIVEEVRKEMIFLGETVLQIWTPTRPRAHEALLSSNHTLYLR